MKKWLFRALLSAALSVMLLTAVSAEGMLYEDECSGASFTIPTGWELREIYDEDVYNISLYSPSISGSSIVYWCGDLCEEDESVRSEVNNEFMTKEDVAEIYEITPEQVEIVYYNGSSYFRMEEEYEITVHGIDGTYTVTQLAHFRDGWMHQFEFLGTEESEGFSDFESLMNTVEYPSLIKEETVHHTFPTELPNLFEEAVAPYAPKDPIGDMFKNTTADIGSETAMTAEEDRTGTQIGLSSLSALVAAGIGIGLAATRHKRSSKKKSPDSRIKTKEPSVKHKMTAVCGSCGARLPEGSKVCHLCGSKIRKP